jgi:hypothetical protein
VGAKTWMLVYAGGNAASALKNSSNLDSTATRQLVQDLFPKEKIEPIGDGDLSYTCPPDNEIHAGCFPGVSIVAAKEFGIDHPSKLAPSFISAGGYGNVYLHAMHSVVDWFAYAQWSNGQLIRSLSLSPDSGILEDIGQRLPFEEPFWSAQYSETETDYPFPFHPLEFGEAALKDLFGYQLEGLIDPTSLEPESVPLIKYKRSRSRWKLW